MSPPHIESSDGCSVRVRYSLAPGPAAVPVAAVLGWDPYKKGYFRVLQAGSPGWVRTRGLRSGEWRQHHALTGAAPWLGVAVGPARALIATEGDRPTVALWDLDEAVLLASLCVDGSAVHALAASADGTVAAVQCDESVFVYALPATAPAAVIPGVAPVAVSADGRMIVAQSTARDRLLVHRADGTLLAALPCPEYATIGAALFSRDGRTVLAGLGDGTCVAWDLASGQLRWRTERVEPRGRVVALERLPDGRKYFSLDTRGRLASFAADGKARFSQQLRRPVGDPHERPMPAPQIVASRDGDHIAVALPDSAVRIFVTATGAEPARTDRDRRGPALALSHDGRFVASGGVGGMVRVDEVATADTLWTLEVDPTEVTSVEFLPDRAALRTSGRDGVVRRWNLATGLEERSWVTPNTASLRTRGALDGARVLVHQAHALELWSELAPRRVVWSVHPNGAPVTCECFSDRESLVFFALDRRDAKGHWLPYRWAFDAASGAWSGPHGRFFRQHFVTLQETDRGPLSLSWDAGVLVVTEEWGALREQEFAGPAWHPWRARYSTDGRWLVIADAASVEVYRLFEGAARVARIELGREGDAVAALAVSADGAVFAVGTEGGSVLVFERDGTG